MTLFLVAVALLTLVVLVLPKLYHTVLILRAKRTATHFLLTPTGSVPEVWDKPVTAIAGIINTLSSTWGGFTIHRWKDETDPQLAITIWGSKDPESLAKSYALAIGARAEKIDLDLPLWVDGPAFTVVRTGFNQSASVAGDDLTRTAEWVTSTLNKADETATIHIGVQAMSRFETKPYQNWVKDKQLATQQVNQTFGVLCRSSIIATGTESEIPRELASSVTSLIPNFLFSVKAEKIADYRAAFPVGMTALATSAVLYFLAPIWTVLAALPIWILAGMLALDRLHIRQKILLNRLNHGVIYNPSPAPIGWGTIGRLLGSFIGGEPVEEPGEEVKSKRLPSWKRSVLPFNTGHVTALTMFTGKLTTGAASATSRNQTAPAKAREAKGVPIGKDTNEQWAHIPDDDRSGGLFIAGDPNMGKTVGLTGIWFGDVAYKLATDQPRTLLWIETKGEGAESAIRTAIEAGAKKKDLLVIDINNPKSPLPDFVNHGDPLRSAELLTEAMKYAFEQGAIMGQAENVLKSALYLALSIPDDIKEKLGNPSAMEIAYLIVGGNDKNDAYSRVMTRLKNIAETRSSKVIDPDSDEEDDIGEVFDSTEDHFVEAIKEWSQFDQLTKNKRLETTNSSRNGINRIRRQKSIWDPEKKVTPIAQIINSHKVVIVNFGSPIQGKGQEVTLDPKTKTASERLSAMFLYLLWDNIRAECSGWNAQGKGIYVYSDELSMIASDGGTGENIIEAMRDQGRSYGVKLNFATQRIDQLGPDTQSAVLSFKNKIYLGSETPEIAEIYVNDLTAGEEGSYTVSDVRNLKSLHGLARVNIEGQSQPPFNIKFTLPPDLDKEEALEGWK